MQALKQGLGTLAMRSGGSSITHHPLSTEVSARCRLFMCGPAWMERRSAVAIYSMQCCHQSSAWLGNGFACNGLEGDGERRKDGVVPLCPMRGDVGAWEGFV